jgi:hypothetical protein
MAAEPAGTELPMFRVNPTDHLVGIELGGVKVRGKFSFTHMPGFYFLV